MVLIYGYVRKVRASAVLRALHETGIGGATVQLVHGLSGEKSTFLYSSHPFEPTHLPESIKIEIICAEDRIDQILDLFAKQAKTGEPGDGIIAIQPLERVMRIRDL